MGTKPSLAFSLNISPQSGIIKIAAGREETEMTTMPVNVPKIWSQLNGTNQKHALIYMEFLYHQQQEIEVEEPQKKGE